MRNTIAKFAIYLHTLCYFDDSHARIDPIVLELESLVLNCCMFLICEQVLVLEQQDFDLMESEVAALPMDWQ